MGSNELVHVIRNFDVLNNGLEIRLYFC